MANEVSEVTETWSLLSAYQAKPLLKARTEEKSSARSSLDLNRSQQNVALEAAGVRFESGLSLEWPLIEEIADEERRVFHVEHGKATPVQVFSEATGWQRTLCASESAPTTLVSGIPMHRIKDTDPMKDTAAKIKALGPIKGKVLDTATGLGYTAIAAAKFASEVVTIELDPAAIELAHWNPWSADLFRAKNIRQIVGDSFEEIQKLDPGAFAGIIHDPPTMVLGGELYSEEFYGRLHRLLRRGGKLFHYIADPKSSLGKRTYPGVMKRLRLAGFAKIAIEEEAYGLTAIA